MWPVRIYLENILVINIQRPYWRSTMYQGWIQTSRTNSLEPALFKYFTGESFEHPMVDSHRFNTWKCITFYVRDKSNWNFGKFEKLGEKRNCLWRSTWCVFLSLFIFLCIKKEKRGIKQGRENFQGLADYVLIWDISYWFWKEWKAILLTHKETKGI